MPKKKPSVKRLASQDDLARTLISKDSSTEATTHHESLQPVNAESSTFYSNFDEVFRKIGPNSQTSKQIKCNNFGTSNNSSLHDKMDYPKTGNYKIYHYKSAQSFTLTTDISSEFQKKMNDLAPVWPIHQNPKKYKLYAVHVDSEYNWYRAHVRDPIEIHEDKIAFRLIDCGRIAFIRRNK